MRTIKRVLIVCGMSAIVLFLVVVALSRGDLATAQSTSLPSIAVSPGYSMDVDPDSVAEYVHTITNTGAVDVLVGFQAVASAGWPVDFFNATYPGGTTVGMPLPLQAGGTMTMGIRLTVPVTASPGVVNTTTLTVTLIYEGEPYMAVAVKDIAIVREQEPQRRYIYLPLVLRNHALLQNGDFSDGLEKWTSSGVLGTSVALDPSNPSNPVARLGNPGFACWDGVPIGSGVIQQQFTVPRAAAGKSMHLLFRYRIYTNDRNVGLTGDYDTFDVLINGVLRLRDANQTDFNYCNVAPYDLGWRAADIDLGAGGVLVNLSLGVYNRYDRFYNTYVYVDDVRLVEGN